MSLLKLHHRAKGLRGVDTLNDSYEACLKALLTAPGRPTAVLVSDDILAVVLEQFCNKLNLRIPKDRHRQRNNSLFSRICSPQLTAVDVNPIGLASEGVADHPTTSKTPTCWPGRVAAQLISGELLPAAGGHDLYSKNHHDAFLMNGF